MTAGLRRQRFESRPLQPAFEESLRCGDASNGASGLLDLAIAELAGEPPFAEIVGSALLPARHRHADALALTVELGDWTRFRPRALGLFLGVTPSEDSTGERRRLGAIAKTGNTHARRLLVEAAWQQRLPLRESATLARRFLAQRAALLAGRAICSSAP
jgi:hypothetical protein